MSESANENADDYGVLTRARLTRWIGALVVASTAVATCLGFLGASHGISLNHFNWSLAAVTGTAVGTGLLAGFTGALAWTTSGDVRATIRLADATQEEQRARDRPIVVVRLIAATSQALDPAARKTVPVLRLWLNNVGLAPALDLRLRARYGDLPAPTEEVVAVVGVNEPIELGISLAGVDEPATGFSFAEFLVEGDCFDRTRTERHPVIVLANEGLVDQMREAEEQAKLRAWLELMPGQHDGPTGEVVIYRSQVQNNGEAEAVDVRLQLVDDSNQDYGSPLIVGTVPARQAVPVEVRCPYPQPRFSCRLTWRDGRTIQQSRDITGAYPALGLQLPPAAPA